MPRWFLRGVLLFVLVFVALVVLVLAHERRDPDPPQARPRPAAVGLGGHLRALQRIASEHGGNRATGSAGERATIAYVAARLRDAGYRVERQAFEVPFFRAGGPPRLRVGGERVRARTLQFSAGGRATGVLRAVGLGCAAGDFSALRRGEVAVAVRGTCTFAAKARGAARAGAAALVIADSEPFDGSLGRPAELPVVAAGTAVTRHAGEPATVVVDAVSETRKSGNVIAADGPRDAARVTMAGAHLDSVPAGPGLNDNGSGVAALLHLAERLGPRDLPLRFGFWGAEEIGLVGSRRYVRSLTAAERDRIAGYLNLDMVGSPDAEPAVYGAGRIEAALRRRLGRDAREAHLGGASDHASFADAGIPAGGIFTGLDACYHRRCDTIENVDRAVLAESAGAAEGALAELAR